jgi:HEAT repeat protein
VGLLDLIKPKSALEKASKALRQQYSQPEYRREAMQKLIEIGTEEAYDALLGRFTFNSHGQIADEEEKNDLVEELVRIGKPAVPSLKKFIQNEKQIAFPIRALSRLVSRQDLLDFLIETLKKYEPLDHRSTQAKATLVLALHDYGGSEQADVVVPYLKDHHDDVQFQAIGALEKFKNDSTREALAAVCVGSDHAARIQGRAAQALAELEWPVKDRYEQMSSEVKSVYLLSKKGCLVRRQAPGAKESKED